MSLQALTASHDIIQFALPVWPEVRVFLKQDDLQRIDLRSGLESGELQLPLVVVSADTVEPTEEWGLKSSIVQMRFGVSYFSSAQATIDQVNDNPRPSDHLAERCSAFAQALTSETNASLFVLKTPTIEMMDNSLVKSIRHSGLGLVVATIRFEIQFENV